MHGWIGKRGVGVRNLELKVAVDDEAFAEIARRARRLGASRTLYQHDTYFNVPVGRLKLRETHEGTRISAELIGYSRPNHEGARWSEYYRADFLTSQIAPFITMMKSTIGVKTEVEKRREVVVTGRTRIHLDHVTGMGNFVELETVVDSEDGDDGADVELADIAGMLGLGAYPAIAGSYSDLMEGNERT